MRYQSGTRWGYGQEASKPGNADLKARLERLERRFGAAVLAVKAE